MTSFLNKKFNLILLVLATLIIATAITGASAASVTASFNDGTIGTKTINASSVVNINGTYNNSGLVNTSVNNRTVTIVGNDQGRGGSANSYLIDNGNVTTGANGNWSYTLNISKVRALGLTTLEIWVYDNETPHGFVVNSSISVNYLDTPRITIVPINSTPAVGQEATFLVTVTGRNVTNASQIINLTDVKVNIIDQLGNSVFNGTTNGTGQFIFAYNVTAINFYFNATTNMSASTITIPAGTFPYSTFFTEANATVPFTAVKGQSNLTQLWFDSPFGYVVGQPATILWNFEGIALSTVGNRTITLFYYDGNKLRRTEVVPLYSPITVNGRSALGHWNTTFTQPHDNLTVVAVFPEDTEYLRSEVRNSTFVDANNSSRRTTITFNLPSAGLQVGVTSDIQINVARFDGTPVQSGSVTVLWDGKFRFDVPVVNGTAFFTHTYTTAGAARNVTFTYNGEEDGTRVSSISTTVPVLKGNPAIVVTQLPQFAVVGQQVTIAGSVNNFALGSTAKFVTLKFVEGNKTWHTISDIPLTFNTDTSAVAQVTYIYTMTHTSLSLIMNFAGDSNYNAASGTTTTIVSPAPVI